MPLAEFLPITVSEGFLALVQGVLSQRACSNLLRSSTAGLKRNDNICIMRAWSALRDRGAHTVTLASRNHLALVT
jgi:hypothetical protein